MNTATTLAITAAVCGLALASAPARADHDDSDKAVSCSSNDGHRVECPANLRGYTLSDVDQSSRTDCVVGRNWGYDDRGVWVDNGCRATFKFEQGGHVDHPRSYSYRDAGTKGEDLKVKCESKDGHRSNCKVDLRGYRIADVRELSRADCDIGRNFGYDDRGVWVDNGCRGEFIFTGTRDGRLSDSRDRDDRYDDRR